MNKPVFRAPGNLLIPTLLGLVACAVGPAQAQDALTISDCRAIEGELARYACYESLEDPGSAAATPSLPTPAAVTPTPPVSRVGSPSLNEADLPRQSAKVETAAETASSGPVEGQDAKPGLLRRLLPFGSKDENDSNSRESDTAIQDAAPARVADSTEVESFGRDQSGSARVDVNDQGGRELVDTVASIKALSPSMFEITLDSGQVWRQMINKRYPIRVGDTVTIRSTRWGSSYRLTSERVSGFIQVVRVD